MFHHTRHYKTVLQLSRRAFRNTTARKRHRRQCVAALRQLLANTGSPLHVFKASRAGVLRCSQRCSINTALLDECSKLTPVTSVTTFKNWWQLGFHPKFAIDTLSFYSVGDTSRPRHITCVLVWSKSDQRRLRKTLHKQTDKPTDTTKIMVTWPWTNKKRFCCHVSKK